MKKKIIILLSIATAVVIGSNFHLSHNKNLKTKLLLSNAEALANPDDGTTEKKYRYDDGHGDCYIYVGGAYAKGTPVVCWNGDEHPVCVTCKL